MQILSLEQCKTATNLHPEVRQQIYNALDCTGTLEIFNVLRPRLNPVTLRTYLFELAQQSACAAATLKGTRIDVLRKNELVATERKNLARLVRDIAKHEIISLVWDGAELESGKCDKSTRKDGKHKWPRSTLDGDPSKICECCGAPRYKRSAFNANSHTQVAHLFYDILKCPVQTNKSKKPSTDEDCLNRLKKKRPQYEELIDVILGVKDAQKQIGTLETKLSPDNRWHASFRVGGTWTGRYSSSPSPMGYGANQQNLTERHRIMFVADAGKLLSYCDLERAESLGVAHIAGDDNYIEAHDGDTHTIVARIVWPHLPWNGDLKKDKKIATETLVPWKPIEGHGYRLYSKKVQHGSNYGLTPPGMSMIAKMPIKECALSQRNYFDAFPYIPGWHAHEKAAVENCETLVNPLGRSIRLFGRPLDGHTVNQALAFKPQSLIGDILNTAFWRIWRRGEAGIELLAQIHDAVLSQFDKAKRDKALRVIWECMNIPVDVTDYRGNTRRMTIGVELSEGLNWGHQDPGKILNPNGQHEVKVDEINKNLALKEAEASLKKACQVPRPRGAKALACR